MLNLFCWTIWFAGITLAYFDRSIVPWSETKDSYLSTKYLHLRAILLKSLLKVDLLVKSTIFDCRLPLWWQVYLERYRLVLYILHSASSQFTPLKFPQYFGIPQRPNFLHWAKFIRRFPILLIRDPCKILCQQWNHLKLASSKDRNLSVELFRHDVVTILGLKRAEFVNFRYLHSDWTR